MTASREHDDRVRCRWAAATPEFYDYHDTEWGFAVIDDRQLFERICLESFQSGLSWRTILAKRTNFRDAFANFDFRIVAEFGDTDVERLLGDRGIVRHRGKIEAVINNAARVVDLVDQGSTLAQYLWQYAPFTREIEPAGPGAVPASAVALSKELKRRGWKFVGPTTVLAFMQAAGLVNDHDVDCDLRHRAAAQRRELSNVIHIGF